MQPHQLQKTPIPQVSRNFWNSQPTEFHVPRSAKYVVVSDFFASDLQGGAELTTHALVEHIPRKDIFFLHSVSLTEQLVETNKNKVWILANIAFADTSSLLFLSRTCKYVFIEFDYKLCKYRSLGRHFLSTGKKCDCLDTEHGDVYKSLVSNSKNNFFMSSGQKQVHEEMYRGQLTKNLVLGSLFSTKTLDTIKRVHDNLTSNTELKTDVWGVLSPGGSWIKGSEATMEWCRYHNLNAEFIPSAPHDEFLIQLGAYKGLVFHPLDFDTCPRVTIEAKLLGLELMLNDKVQHKDDQWFQEITINNAKNMFDSKKTMFWDIIYSLSS